MSSPGASYRPWNQDVCLTPQTSSTSAEPVEVNPVSTPTPWSVSVDDHKLLTVGVYQELRRRHLERVFGLPVDQVTTVDR